MKKTLPALAILGAFAGAAQAQSSVTIYGSYDAGLRNQTNIDAAGNSRLSMGSNGTFSSNRLGFKGTEDLGGGLSANFVLESGFNTGTGSLDNTATVLFNRSAWVGIGSKPWGSVNLGRQYSINFKTIADYDPFNYKYVAIIPLAAQGSLTRLNNDIQYNGIFGGLTVRAEYALGEQTGSASNGSAQALGVSYAGGPFSAGMAYTQRKNAVGTLFADQKNWTVGGAYDAGSFRIAGGYADNKQATGTAAIDTRIKDGWIGGSYKVSPAMGLTVAYYRTQFSAATGNTDGRRNMLMVGGTYALSKRTNFYADIDNAKFNGTATTLSTGQSNRTAVSVGINHLF